tara:strand:- start:473 stop:643 length:171 start_codon:yes stop_codon:yes gene_type:complete
MDWTYLVGALAIITLLAGVVVAMISKKKTEGEIKDPNDPKSTLAKDGDPHGKPKDV